MPVHFRTSEKYVKNNKLVGVIAVAVIIVALYFVIKSASGS
jgi:hypothetical protein